MIKLLIKNGDDGKLLLIYSKGNSAPLNLLTIDDLGLLRLATADARRSYPIIDSIKKILREEKDFTESVDIVVDNNYIHSDSNNLTTMFRYLTNNIDTVDIHDNKIMLSYKKSA